MNEICPVCGSPMVRRFIAEGTPPSSGASSGNVRSGSDSKAFTLSGPGAWFCTNLECGYMRHENSTSSPS
jgi:hypothetical protein